MLFIDDNANYAPSFKGTLAQGLIAIEMLVNKRALRMIVDTGAPISYIKRTIVAGLAPVREVEDFNPLIGIDLLKRYRIQIKDGKLFLPPQGI